MNFIITAVASRRSKAEAADRLLSDYKERIARYVQCDSQVFNAEVALLNAAKTVRRGTSHRMSGF
jgi:hypothetical protein